MLNSDAHFNIFGLLEHYISRQYVLRSLSLLSTEKLFGKSTFSPSTAPADCVLRVYRLHIQSVRRDKVSAQSRGEIECVCVWDFFFFVQNCVCARSHSGTRGTVTGCSPARVQDVWTKSNRRSKRRERNEDQTPSFPSSTEALTQ